MQQYLASFQRGDDLNRCWSWLQKVRRRAVFRECGGIRTERRLLALFPWRDSRDDCTKEFGLSVWDSWYGGDT
jgi:hypothetical protein